MQNIAGSGNVNSSSSLNKHELGNYQKEKERERESKSTRSSPRHNKEESLGIKGKSGVVKTRSIRIPESSLQKLAEQAKEENFKKLDTSVFKDLKLPLSARDLEPALDAPSVQQVNRITTEPSPSTTVISSIPPITMTSSDQRMSERRDIMRKLIQDYVLSKGCVTSDHSIDYLLSMHSTNIQNATSDLELNSGMLDMYAKGWLDCNQQMGATNLTVLATKIDPLLNQMAQIMVALRDNDVLKKIDELKGMLIPSTTDTSKPPPPVPISSRLDRGKAPMVLDDTPTPMEEIPPLIAYDTRLNYQNEWKEISSDQRRKLAIWAGKKLLGVYTAEQMEDPANIVEVVKRMTGAGLLYLLRMNTAKTHETLIKTMAQEMWSGKK